jgi:hypothetical protein
LQGGGFRYASGFRLRDAAFLIGAGGVHFVPHAKPKRPDLVGSPALLNGFIVKGALWRAFFSFVNDDRRRVRDGDVSAKLLKHLGEVAERFKAHAWKACVG